MQVSRRTLLATGVSLGAGGLSTIALKAQAQGTLLSPPLPDSHALGIYVFGVEAQGYVAEEYLMSGKADVYETVDMADAFDFTKRDNAADLGRRTFERKLTAADQPYVTRLIVYRPKDKARFSGNVIIESIHPSNGGTASVWGPMNAFFMGHGDAYCLVQHPVTIPGTRDLAPDRYGKLASVHPTQIWGMLRDAAHQMRRIEGPLAGYAARRRLYMTGYSYTGVATATFANFHHAAAKQADGKPLFDGYLPMANATYVRPLDVPVMRMNTQSDFDSFDGLHDRSPDSDAQGSQYRLYEVTGAAHVRTPLPLENRAAAPAFAKVVPTAPGQPHNDPNVCYASFPKGSRPNDVPFPLAASAMFVNLYAWRDRGIAPPPGVLIETAADGSTLTDADGNARGGLRLPELSVPAATYGVGKGACMLFGYAAPFDASKMKALYGSKDRYLAKVRAAAEAMVQGRLLRPDAVEVIVGRANEHPAF